MSPKSLVNKKYYDAKKEEILARRRAKYASSKKLKKSSDQEIVRPKSSDRQIKSSDQSMSEEFDIVAILKRFVSVLPLCVMICGLTAFLVVEQKQFYDLKNYSPNIAWFYSILFELSCVVLSFLVSWAVARKQKNQAFLTACLLFCQILVLGCICYESVEKRASTVEALTPAQKNLESQLEKNLAHLEATSKKELASIEKLPENYLTQRKKGNQKYKEGTGQELSGARADYTKFLKEHQYKSASSSSENWVMIIIRWLAIIMNSSFAISLGFVWRFKPKDHLNHC